VPTYEYRCESCDHDFERVLRIAQYDEPQTCPACGASPARKRVSLNAGFILSGDGWTGKNISIANQMARKNRRLDTKQNEMKRDAPAVTLTPNVDGERVGSWTEARKLAESKGKDASSYDAVVRKERADKS
jgi:putative FmdB family regulatory protein